MKKNDMYDHLQRSPEILLNILCVCNVLIIKCFGILVEEG